MRNYRILFLGVITTIVMFFSSLSLCYAKDLKKENTATASVMPVSANDTLSDLFETEKPAPKHEATSSSCALPNFVKLAKSVSPAVVNIRTLVKPKQVFSPFDGPDNPFSEFFRRLYPQERQAPEHNQKPVPKYLGSGFILSHDGYILTNAHVIKDADEIMVKLRDRREFKAKIIGSDKATDLALLKIDAKDLPVLQLGDTTHLKPGQWVMAIGSPYGLDYTVTKGIISALNRSLSSTTYVPFIQTDVPINPGNSGGPLVDMNGSVIGVNSQIVTTSGGFMGLSFAIPADEAAYVVKQLKAHGKVERGWLGVTFQDIDQNLAKSFKLPHPEGALISQVVPNSPAAKAGFKSGDIILEFNKQKVEYFNDLPAIVGRIPVGTKAEAKVWRDGKMITLEATIKKQNSERDSATGARLSEYLGIGVQSLDDQWRKTLNISDDQQISGVIVTSIPRDSVGAQWELRPRDIITNLDGRPITNKKDFDEADKALAKRKQELKGKKGNGENVSIRIIRDGAAYYKAYPLEESNDSHDKLRDSFNRD